MSEETPQQGTPQPQAAPSADSKDVEENKMMAVIAYIWLLFLIPLLTKKDSPFAQFHAKQGLVLFVASLILGIISGVIPFIGWFVLAPIVSIVTLIWMIIGIINAVNGKMKELPLIGQFGRKINL